MQLPHDSFSTPTRLRDALGALAGSGARFLGLIQQSETFRKKRYAGCWECFVREAWACDLLTWKLLVPGFGHGAWWEEFSPTERRFAGTDF